MSGLQDEIKRSAGEYAHAFKELASTDYLKNRAAAAEKAREALQSTSHLARIEPETVKENPDRLEALCNMCLPPLSRDRLAALSGVPARRIMSLQRGELPTRYSSRVQLVEEDLPAICRVLSEMIDTDLAPWIKEDRPCSRGEESELVAVAADRMSSARTKAVSACTVGAFFEKQVRMWLESHGYAAEKPGSPATPGTYRRERGMGDLVVVPGKGNDQVILDVRCFSDPSNAIRARIRMEETAKAADAGWRYVYVIAGCADTPLIAHLEQNGIDYVWAHDLDKLKEYGL